MVTSGGAVSVLEVIKSIVTAAVEEHPQGGSALLQSLGPQKDVMVWYTLLVISSR